MPHALQEGEGVLQGPIPLARTVKSSGFDVALEVLLGPPKPVTGAHPSDSAESGAPAVFFGDYQVGMQPAVGRGDEPE